MSLILEALRKSEAERRRGHMPDLHAELPPAPARTAPATPWPWRIAVAAAALLALAAWVATSALRSRETAAVAQPAASVVAAPPALPRVSHLQAMPRSQQPSAPAKPTPALADDAGKTVPVTPAMAKAVAPETLDRPARVDPGPATTEAPRATRQSATTAALPPPPAGADVAPMQLSDLAPEARKALPPLRLSMHLWNDDPSRRFVILDGERLAEGDRIGNLVVTAIVRDGVLLDWNGRALKVPLR
jgi:general secretion pathway protein B